MKDTLDCANKMRLNSLQLTLLLSYQIRQFHILNGNIKLWFQVEYSTTSFNYVISGRSIFSKVGTTLDPIHTVRVHQQVQRLFLLWKPKIFSLFINNVSKQLVFQKIIDFYQVVSQYRESFTDRKFNCFSLYSNIREIISSSYWNKKT